MRIDLIRFGDGTFGVKLVNERTGTGEYLQLVRGTCLNYPAAECKGTLEGAKDAMDKVIEVEKLCKETVIDTWRPK